MDVKVKKTLSRSYYTTNSFCWLNYKIQTDCVYYELCLNHESCLQLIEVFVGGCNMNQEPRNVTYYINNKSIFCLVCLEWLI